LLANHLQEKPQNFLSNFVIFHVSLLDEKRFVSADIPGYSIYRNLKLVPFLFVNLKDKLL
jgi:hypothetical protein